MVLRYGGVQPRKMRGPLSRGKCEWYAFSGEELGDVDYSAAG